MATNKILLSKGIKRLFLALPLMFIGPVLYTNSLSNTHTNWHYVVMGIGILFCLLAMFLAFSGLNTMMKALFNDK